MENYLIIKIFVFQKLEKVQSITETLIVNRLLKKIVMEFQRLKWLKVKPKNLKNKNK